VAAAEAIGAPPTEADLEADLDAALAEEPDQAG
jgi:hypothetical protein